MSKNPTNSELIQKRKDTYIHGVPCCKNCAHSNTHSTTCLAIKTGKPPREMIHILEITPDGLCDLYESKQTYGKEPAIAAQ